MGILNALQRQSLLRLKSFPLSRRRHPVGKSCTKCNTVNAHQAVDPAQSSHGVILQSLAPSPISNFSRSSFHSVYISLVALMASLCPGPELAGLASAALRHIPGQGNIVSRKGLFLGCMAVGSGWRKKYMWQDSCRSRRAVRTSISVTRHFSWLRRGIVGLDRLGACGRSLVGSGI